ncbi:hypothetical protein PUN28_006498 [Cardiocondyla obscurior]|uniref:Uncharacterized protein n=1 Tax=Cardiocondyla obscurior TaxID=286306 RepID=A0AAW2GAL9_9HYME
MVRRVLRRFLDNDYHVFLTRSLRPMGHWVENGGRSRERQRVYGDDFNSVYLSARILVGNHVHAKDNSSGQPDALRHCRWHWYSRSR